MKPVICIEPLYPGLEAHQKIEKVADHGFDTIEFWGWRDKNIKELVHTCQRRGVGVANFSGHRVGSPVAESTHHDLLKDLDAAISIAQTLNCSTLMMLTNALEADGRVTDRFDELSPGEKYENAVLGLQKALDILPRDMSLVLEPLNTQVDHPGYFLTDMEAASAILHDVGDNRLKILCDLYHLGMMGHRLETVITGHIDRIGHFHLADFPGRHEPGTGSADWPFLLGLIKETGYGGYIGFEYFPERDSDASLAEIKTLWETVSG